MGRKGRPRKADKDKRKAVTISISHFECEVIDAIATMDDISRSEVVSALIQTAGFLKAGILEGNTIKMHIQDNQRFKLPKTGLMVCNPYRKDGKVCQNQACQSAYVAEGIL